MYQQQQQHQIQPTCPGEAISRLLGEIRKCGAEDDSCGRLSSALRALESYASQEKYHELLVDCGSIADLAGCVKATTSAAVRQQALDVMRLVTHRLSRCPADIDERVFDLQVCLTRHPENICSCLQIAADLTQFAEGQQAAIAHHLHESAIRFVSSLGQFSTPTIANTLCVLTNLAKWSSHRLLDADIFAVFFKTCDDRLVTHFNEQRFDGMLGESNLPAATLVWALTMATPGTEQRRQLLSNLLHQHRAYCHGAFSTWTNVMEHWADLLATIAPHLDPVEFGPTGYLDVAEFLLTYGSERCVFIITDQLKTLTSIFTTKLAPHCFVSGILDALFDRFSVCWIRIVLVTANFSSTRDSLATLIATSILGLTANLAESLLGDQRESNTQLVLLQQQQQHQAIQAFLRYNLLSLAETNLPSPADGYLKRIIDRLLPVAEQIMCTRL